MLRRTYLLNRLVGRRNFSFLVGRHPVVYAKVVIRFVGLSIFLLLFWKLLQTTFPDAIVITTVFAILGALLYLVGIFFLLRSYFDIMVGTKDHLYIVWRDSFFKYHLKILARSSIQDISFSPAGKIGVLIKNGDMLISTKQDEVIPFENIYKPDLIAKKMYELREDSLLPEEEEFVYDDHTAADDEKFKVLVETLGEVIVDYMKKKDE